MLLDLRNIKISYGKALAVKGVSLHLNEGEIVVVIGANGAGKSTIMRAVSGLKQPQSGEIWYSGRRIDALPSHVIAKLGIRQVPERRRLFPRLSVFDNLKIGAYLEADKEKVQKTFDELMRKLPILSVRRRQMAGTLSGGEQQMVTIARALMLRPKVLLLDEPSLGLAPLIVREIGRIVREIHTDGVPILLVEQNAKLALGLASRGYVLETGKIALEGRAKELLNDEGVKRAYLGG